MAMLLQPAVSSRPARGFVRWRAVVWLTIVGAGVVASWGKGAHPHRGTPPSQSTNGVAADQRSNSDAGGEGTTTETATAILVADRTSPDLQLYRSIVNSMRGGDRYYDAARRRLAQYGFAMASPFNWRLPTVAWCMSWSKSPQLLYFGLLGLMTVAMALLLVAVQRESGWVAAIGTVLLEVGVLRYAFDWATFYAHEMWAASFILIWAAALGLGWRRVALAAGLGALFIRELALPLCIVSACFAWRNGRRREALTWCAGMVLFFGYLAWHMCQVNWQTMTIDAPGTAGVEQWLQFGGLSFVLSTLRMNMLLAEVSGPVLFLYLALSLTGLMVVGNEWRQTILTICAMYLVAFAIIGQPFNFYWGLLFAPLLPIGLFRAPEVLQTMFRTPFVRESIRAA